MGLCVLYYVEYSLYNVKKVGFFYLGWNYTLSWDHPNAPSATWDKNSYRLINKDLC